MREILFQGVFTLNRSWNSCTAIEVDDGNAKISNLKTNKKWCTEYVIHWTAVCESKAKYWMNPTWKSATKALGKLSNFSGFSTKFCERSSTSSLRQTKPTLDSEALDGDVTPFHWPLLLCFCHVLTLGVVGWFSSAHSLTQKNVLQETNKNFNFRYTKKGLLCLVKDHPNWQINALFL